MVIKGRPHFTVARASLASIGLETCRYIWWGCQRGHAWSCKLLYPIAIYKQERRKWDCGPILLDSSCNGKICQGARRHVDGPASLLVRKLRPNFVVSSL
ncbi:hypothetical protein Peur_049798 [Populus x canadensis]